MSMVSNMHNRTGASEKYKRQHKNSRNVVELSESWELGVDATADVDAVEERGVDDLLGWFILPVEGGRRRC